MLAPEAIAMSLAVPVVASVRRRVPAPPGVLNVPPPVTWEVARLLMVTL